MSAPQSDSVAGILDELQRRIRRKGILAAVLLGGGVLASVLPLAWLFTGAGGWQAGSPLPIGLILIAGGGGGLLGWGVHRRIRTRSRERALAADLERTVGLASGSLWAQVELEREVPAGGSPGLARAGNRRMIDRLGSSAALPSAGVEVESGRWIQRGLLGVLSVLGLALLLFLWTPERSRLAWAGLLHPVEVLRPERLPLLRVWPGEARLPRGLPVAVRIEAPERSGVTLHWVSRGDLPRLIDLRVEAGVAEGELPPLNAETRYWVSAPDGATTPEFLLSPQDPLLLSGLVLELRYPAYTGQAPEVLRGEISRMEIPAGTEIRVSGELNGEGEAVFLRGERGERLASFPLTDGAFLGSWIPVRSERVSWEVPGGGISERRLPEPLDVEVIPDAPPRVRLEPESGIRRVPADLRMALRLLAEDDWGLDWVELELLEEDLRGRLGEASVDRSPAGLRREVVLRPVVDLSARGLEPGSRIRLRARAADAARVPGITVSPDLILELPTERALAQEARDEVERGTGAVESLLERVSQEEINLRDRTRAMARIEADARGAGSGVDPQLADEEMQRLQAEQEAVAGEIERIRSEIARARALLGEGGGDSELARRLDALERMLEPQPLLPGSEAGDPGSRRTEAGERGEPSLTQRMEEAGARQAELRAQLEAVLERFQQAALDNAFEGAETAARALSEAQQDAASELRQGGNASVQETVREGVGEVQEQVRILEDRLTEAGEARLAEAVARAGRELESTARAMDSAAEAARRGNREGSGDRADEAAQSAQGVAEQLEQARSEFSQEWEERIRDALRDAARHATALARMQGEIRVGFSDRLATDRVELVAEAASILEGVRALATRVGLELRPLPEVSRELSRSLGRALEALETTATGLRSAVPRSSPWISAAEAQDALNRTALQALRGLEQLGQGGGGGAQEQWMEALESLAEQQEQLNQQAGDMAQSDPSGQAASEGDLEGLAQAQQSLAGAMGELAQQPGGESASSALEALSEEAKQIAEALGEGRLEPEVLRRQEALLERLLAAGRTLEREGPTELREGRPAGLFERRPVEALPADLLRGGEMLLPSSQELDALTPAERRLVQDYFDRLNRRGGGPQ